MDEISTKSFKATGIKDFDLKQIFESGQCFRWKINDEGYYEGAAAQKALQLRELPEEEGSYLLRGTDEDEYKSFWYDYFDLGRDYSLIRNELAELDPVMAEAVKYGKGLRILKQEFWETLISFILSSNNMIPRISKSIEILSSAYGKPIIRQKGIYSFPDYLTLHNAGIDCINICRGGFRCKYISKAAEMAYSGNINEAALRELSTDEARRELMKVPGVGAKVADCVLLYTGISFDVFPVDVWVRRIMQTLYFKREVPMKEIGSFALNHFGKLAGFAQLYLFYYARKNNIGK